MITEYTLQALADGELSEDEAKRIRRKLQENPYWQTRYKEIKQQNKLLKTWWETYKKDH